MERLRRLSDERGFALAFVVFTLFMIGILGSAGYSVIALEADMALQSDDALEAGAVAKAGLARYLGEHLGIPEDTTTYAIGGGTAIVTARRIAHADTAAAIDLYQIKSEGLVADPKFPNSPASRVVTQYAYLHTEPIARVAAAMLSYSSVTFNFFGTVWGYDGSVPGTCEHSGEDLYAVAHRGSLSVTDYFGWLPTVEGSPSRGINLNTHAAVYDSVGLRWDVLTDPDFPVDYEGTFPNFWALPADEFPVIRTAENFTANSSHSGRGVLIVPGRLTFSNGFTWDGIVLAGELADITYQSFYIYGMLIAGLDNSDNTMYWRGYPFIYYDACNAVDASNSLAYFEAIEGSWWDQG